MENTLENILPLKESLVKYCNEIDLDANVIFTQNSNAKFNIKITNKFSRNLVNSLVQNIINIKEDSFYEISGVKENGVIIFSFLANKGEESKFLSNLLNFIKIIKLSNIFTTKTDTIEQTIPIKMIQTLSTIDEQKLPAFTISYVLPSCQIKIQDNLFLLNDGVEMLNNLQNNPNYTTKFFNIGSNHDNLQNLKLSNIKNFCKTVPVEYSAISNLSLYNKLT